MYTVCSRIASLICYLHLSTRWLAADYNGSHLQCVQTPSSKRPAASSPSTIIEPHTTGWVRKVWWHANFISIRIFRTVLRICARAWVPRGTIPARAYCILHACACTCTRIMGVKHTHTHTGCTHHCSNYQSWLMERGLTTRMSWYVWFIFHLGSLAVLASAPPTHQWLLYALSTFHLLSGQLQSGIRVMSLLHIACQSTPQHGGAVW